MKIYHKTLLTLLAILVATPAFSQPQTPGPLKPQHVEGFLDALMDMEAWADQNNRTLESIESPDEADDYSAAYAGIIAGLHGQETLDEVTQIVKRHGFGDLESWANTGTRTMQAFAALKYDATASERAAAMKKALKQIDDSPMDEGQKEAMRKMLDTSAEVMQIFEDVSDDDKRAVAPFMERIENQGAEEDDAQ
ncbi:MAG: hypothetical protein HKN37_17280 [Rhodothermales bacterium]|nr:hypothetical protein [Rhodothermales bacterium]